MVLSKVNKEISYTELKTIDENDKGRDVTMYQINLFKIPVVIALGEIKFTFVKQGVLFAPVYLVVDESNKIYQVGVYEFPAEQLENLKDSDGDLDISLIEGPLVYSFINRLYIKKCMNNETLVPDYDSGDDEKEDTIGEDDEELEDLSDDEDDDEETGDEGKDVKRGLKNPPPVLVELKIEDDDDDFLKKDDEDEKTDKLLRKKYKNPGKSESQWIEHYMNNNNYGIQDNPGHGDCFFYTIRDGFKSINVDASVKKLRDILTSNVTENVYKNYKERYDMINNEVKLLLRQIPKDKKRKKEFTTKYNTLAKEVKKEKDVPTRKKKKGEAKALLAKIKELKSKTIPLKERELKAAKKNYEDVKWMKNIDNVEQLKKKMRKCDYWADNWSIGAMELALNTKFIILSSDEYRIGNYSRVLTCGDFVPKEIEDKGYFKPKYYLILEHTGNHYKLITYKDKKIYRFYQLPYGIKTKIKEVCMKSKGKTLYNYIPKFAKMIGETIVIPVEEKKDKTPEEIVVETEVQKKKIDDDDEDEEEVVMQTPTPEDENLFNDDTVFYFREGSANKKPGMARGKTMHEKIKDDDIPKFKELEGIKDWRKVLSNMHYNGADYVDREEDGEIKPLFELDGLKWASVEHYYHANKFKKNNPDYYRLFSINSGSQFAFDPKKALGAGGKGGKVREKNPETKKVKIIFSRPRDIVADEDFFDGTNPELVMERGQQAKYEQDDLSKRVLLATKDAKLVHHIKPRGEPKPSVVFYNTMRVRHRLKKKN